MHRAIKQREMYFCTQTFCEATSLAYYIRCIDVIGELCPNTGAPRRADKRVMLHSMLAICAIGRHDEQIAKDRVTACGARYCP